MRSRCFLSGISILFLSAAATAQDGSLTPLAGQDLIAAFENKTMDGIYKTPRERTGTHKFSEVFHSDGTTDYFEGPLLDKGEWLVANRLLCFRYQGPLSGDVSCFNVFRSGTCLYAYNPSSVGRDGQPLNDNHWSVKTIASGDISSCDDLTV